LATAGALRAYGYGLLFYAGLKVLQPAFYAIEKRWLPMIASLIALFVNIGCNYVFVFVFKWGHESLALTTSIVASLNFVFLYFAMRRYAGDIGTKGLGVAFLKVGAATAVMGAQLSSGLRSAQYDGVIGCWYGKGPGLDRASDALRHAVMAGASARGGAVALVGEDPSAKSSTLPTSSDVTLVDLRIPTLYPGDVQEAVDLGRHAIAMSRASGAWTAIRIVEVVADGTGTVELHPERIVPVIPTVEIDGRPFVPHADGQLLTPHTIRMEAELHYTRLELARRYGVDNGLNRITVHGPNDWIGVAAAGHTYHEVREALAVLGLRTDDELRSAGVRLLQVLMPWPLDPAVVREFGHDLAEVVVVEDKNQTLELAVTAALYPLATRPAVVGRRTPDGHPLMPSTGSLSADTIATQLRTRLVQRIAGERLDAPVQRAAALAGRRIPLAVNRTPYFCSGCPHNTSTQAPEGHLVGAGIGCHTMVALMEPGRYGEPFRIS
jgi:indolepyruvate ferredoxin oxidoreductase